MLWQHNGDKRGDKLKWIQTKPKISYKESDSIIEKLTKIRGIEDLDEFLNPTEKLLLDSYDLSNITKARNRILKGIYNLEKIVIFADVDVDGECSMAIMYNYLKQFSKSVTYLSSERQEGHGVITAIEKIPSDTDLLIIVDSSSSLSDACKKIKKRNIDVVIIDHHIIERDNPYAIVVNAQLNDYKNHELSGAGHCLKMIQVLDDTIGSDTWSNFYDLAAVGIHADTMSMKEPENRYIVSHGLKNIKNVGLLALLYHGNADLKNLNTNSIGFTIAPMLNGAARMGNISLALELLTIDDLDRAKALVKEINKLNNKRKKLQRKAIEKWSEVLEQSNDKIGIVIDEDIDKGFAGLIANDLAQKFQRPVLVMSKNEKNEYAGSFRSHNNTNLKEFLNNIPEVTFTAGHPGAGGVNIPVNKLKSFIKRTNDEYKETKKERFVFYDLELDADDVTMSLIEDIMRFNRISGKDMYETKFKVNNLMIMEKSLIGKNADTVKIECDTLDLMKFRVNEEYFNELPDEYSTIEAVLSLNINRWFNFGKKEWIVNLQGFIEDFKEIKDKS